MAYTCSVCQKAVEGDLVVFTDHTQDHIVDIIKAQHPEWVQADGICQKCLEYYHGQMKGEG